MYYLLTIFSDGSKITGWKDDKFELGMDFPNVSQLIIITAVM